MQLSELHLDISEPTQSLEFYTEALGMRPDFERESSDGRETVYTLAYGTGARLMLRYRRDLPREFRYHCGKHDAYWKIGIALADVNSARERLLARGITVTEPCQFHDIGYLCHMEDPDGYTIELLQHRFERNHVPIQPDPELPLGYAPTLGQISLNVRDIERSLRFYRETLGMRLLSRQIVPNRGFTLYFLADTTEALPIPSIDAVENREWLWQRPYTMLELRAFDEPRAFVPHPPESELGFRGMGFSGDWDADDLTDADGIAIRKNFSDPSL